MSQWLEQEEKSLYLFSLSLGFFLLLVLIFRLKRAPTSKLKLPPSPSKLPIIGNLHQLGTLPHRTLRSLAQKHGPFMFIHLGQTPTLVVSSADAAQEILKTHDLIFCSRPHMAIAKTIFYGKDIAFIPYGEYWRQMRKICILQLLSAQRVKSFRPVREEETCLMIENIRISCSSSGVVNLSETLGFLMNDIICRVSLGRKFGGEKGGRQFPKLIEEIAYLLGAFNVGEFIPWLAWVNNFNGFNRRVQKTFKDLDCFLESVIEEHIQKRKRDEGGRHDGVEDLVDVLLGIEKDCSNDVPFDKENIKALIMNFFAAGTDTSSTVIEMAMGELIRHPKIMKEVQEEIREITWPRQSVKEDDLEQMKYLKMVIKETLRLHPPAPLLLPHESIQAIKVQGYDIPAKTRVLVNAWAIQRDPISWEEPEVFQPKRFSSKPVDYRGHDFEFIPFGAGRRGCPGILFATNSIELAMANLLYHFDWAMPDGGSGEDLDITETFGISVHMRDPLVLVANPRF